MTTQRLHHLLARGDVPVPGSLHLRDRAMQADLEAYARNQFRRTGCPCKYLGALVDGKYQPDPSLWGAVTAESKGKTIVFSVGARQNRSAKETALPKHACRQRLVRSPPPHE